MLRRACVKNKLEDKLPRGIFSEFRLDWFPPYNRPKGGTIGTRDKEPSAAGADGFRFREAICPKDLYFSSKNCNIVTKSLVASS